MPPSRSRPVETPPLQPVARRKTVQDLVYEQLREALMSGAFEAEANFTITALAEQFQTSHMPVREALRRLAAEGALRISTSGTAQVPAITLAELADLCRVRIIIEGAAAALAAPNLGPEDLARLSELRGRQEAAGVEGRISDLVAINRAFHFHIYTRAGSPVLMSQIETLWLRWGPYVRLLSDLMADMLKTDPSAGFVRQHDLMLAALRAGDAAGFRAAVEGDIRATESLLAERLAAEAGAGAGAGA